MKNIEGLKSLLLLIIVMIIIFFILGLVFKLLPFLLLAGILIYLYNNIKVKKEIKWFDGTQTDNYYQKVKTIKDEDIIDVEVKVKKEDE